MTKPTFGTLDFYAAVADALNRDAKWLEMSAPITYSMVYELSAPIDKRFFMRFDQGRVIETAELSDGEERSVDFTFSATPAVWIAVIRKDITSTTALATGKLKVDGPQAVLLRQMRKFSYLNDVMANMDVAFPDLA